MSSAISYSWGHSTESPGEILTSNKRFFTQSMNKSIRDVKKLSEKYSHIFENIDETVKVLEKFRDELISSYTIDILKSRNHNQWIDERMQSFNALLFEIKAFFKTLNLEIDSQISINTLESLLNKLPKECEVLRKEITKGKKFLRELEEAKNSINIKKLEELYNDIPKFLQKEREEIARILLREKLKQEKAQNEKYIQIEEENEKEIIDQMKQEAERYYKKLSTIAPSQTQKLTPLYEELQTSENKFRISNILKEIKYRYIKFKDEYITSEILKEDLQSIYKEIDIPEEKEIIKTTLEKELITKEEYENLRRNITETILSQKREEVLKKEKEKISNLMHQKLRELGYSVVDENAVERLKNGEILELNTPFGEDYAVRVKLDENGSLAFRFVRYVDDENALTEYEKEKDKSTAKQWCQTHDNLMELLKNEGIVFNTKYRVEPEERFYYEKKEEREERRMQEKQKQQQQGYLRRELWN